MFGRQNVYATLSRFAGIRVKDEREKDPNHLVEVEWEAPLTYDLADEISPPLALDLFDNDGGDFVPKREISGLDPVLTVGRQVMTVRSHPDVNPLGRLTGVEMRRIRFRKSEAGTWIVSFLTSFPFEERTVIGLIKHLTMGLYLTFELESPALDFDAKAAAAGDDQPTAPLIFPGKKRGRPRKHRPEDVAQDQIADARNRADGDDATV